MGWSNFIIIHDFKIVIETNRSVEEISDWEEKSISFLTDEDRYEEQDIGEIKTNNIDIKTLSKLFTIYDNTSSIFGLHPDKFLLYWLKSRNISFEVKSEYNIKKEDLEREGYTIIYRKY